MGSVSMVRTSDRRQKAPHLQRFSITIFRVIVLYFLLCCIEVRAQQQSTDPTETAILKNLVTSYQLNNAVFSGSDPCNTWLSKYIKCDCYYTGNVCHVTRLDFSLTNMVGPFPISLTNLTYLDSLQLYDNNLTGPLPTEIGLLTKLNALSVGSNSLSGSLPTTLGNLQNLQLLHLDSNQFTGGIPFEIGSIKGLRQLASLLDSNASDWETTVLQKVREARNLMKPWLADNNLSGTIPDFFGNFTSLVEVRIHGNSLLQGPIPNSLFNVPSLEEIYLGEISPGSSMPAAFSTPLANLTVLYLRNCRMTGSIPSTIGNFSSLQYLDLSFNQLTGVIPPELAKLSALQVLYLGNNSLTGSLTEDLGNLALTDVDVSYNQLSGTLPTWADRGTSPPIVVSNYFSATSASNSPVLPQLSLLNCKNRKAPCSQSDSGNATSLAVHAGGSQYSNFRNDTASLGTTSIFVSPDTLWAVSTVGYVTGATGFTSLQKTNTPVLSTPSPTLYETARTSLGSLRYYATQLANGKYTVVLSFAEIVYTNTPVPDALARRIFDIYLQGQLVKKDFNIRAITGSSFTAHDASFTAQVTNGVLDVHLFFAGKGTCCIPVGNWSFGPLVSAIAISNVLNSPPAPPTAPGVQVPGPSTTKASSLPLIIGILVGLAVVFLALCFLLRLLLLRRRRRTTLLREDQLEIARFQVQPNLFSYTELKIATRSFHPENKLGEGGYGTVFKGVLPDQTEVAVKTLSARSCQGKQEFLNEAALITAVQHRNLVKLKGCCLERDHRILVYEYLENKSLHQTLFGPRDMIDLDWSTRFNIALGTARGLAYLHEESEARIVHRDIKASNILLDKNFNPKIADFGLARLFGEHESHVSTRVAGTLGYVAPEYALLGQLTEKADVFSYGVVLLELISGRFNIRPDLLGEQAYLLQWAWNLQLQDKLLNLMDQKLLRSYVKEEVLRAIHVALLCTQATANTRPSMTRVVAMLLGDIDIPPTTSGPGFMSGLIDAESLTVSTARTTSSTTSGYGRGSEETPFLISFSPNRPLPQEIFTEMQPR